MVADHGMVSAEETVDLDADPALFDGVEAVAGEARARHVYTREGAVDDVLQAWRARIGSRAWVVARDEAIDAGWFGARVLDEVGTASGTSWRPRGTARSWSAARPNPWSPRSWVTTVR